MKSRMPRLLSLLLLANWLTLVSVFALTVKVRGNLRWWQSLNWNSWLSDLAGLIKLEAIPAGSVWIVWGLLSCLLGLIWLKHRAARPARQDAFMEQEKKEPVGLHSLLDTDPVLNEKILRLHRSLEEI